MNKLFILAGLICTATPALGQETPGADIRIIDIEARLFCDLTGEFTQDVIGEMPVPVGMGEALCASQTTLVLVVVEGPPYNFLKGGRVSLLAEATSLDQADVPPDTVALQSIRLGVFGPDGLLFLPVLLYNTGCNPIDLTAWIEGARRETERREDIVFVCGD